MRFLPPTSKTRIRPRFTPFDVACAIAAPFIALALRSPALLVPNSDWTASIEAYEYALLTIACALLFIAVFRPGDAMSRYLSLRDVYPIIAVAAASASLSATLSFLWNRLEAIPRSTPLIYMLVLIVGLGGGRLIAQWRGLDRRRNAETGAGEPAYARRAILIGVDRFSALAIKLTDCQTPRAVQIVAALDQRLQLLGRTVDGVKIVGGPEDLRAVIEEYKIHGVQIDEVWLSDGLAPVSVAAQSSLGEACADQGVQFKLLSEALNLTSAESTAPFLAPNPVAAAPTLRYFKIKRAIEAPVAVLLLCCLAPIAAIVAGLVAYDVGAPLLFWQKRIGKDGRDFLLYKFRTYQAPFDRDGRSLTSPRAPSKIGAALRKCRLDEFPQLINILRGEMSLIGPRPLLPIDQPEDSRTRLLVRPGITGWAQVAGGTQLSAEEKDALDAWYIHHASPALDFQVVLRTVAYLFHGERKDDPTIEEATSWRRKSQQIDARLFADRQGGPTAKRPEEGAPLRFLSV
jgi:lipopolysaccharide/colanic/teichoic acid biosynthesis glycosyltransferase